MTKQALGIDVGGTKIFHALVNENGEIISEIKKDSTPKTKEEIENKLKEIIKSYEGQTDKAGIATAGACNKENSGIISSTANMPEGYSNIEFKKLSKKIDIKVENDANSAAFAEHKIGCGKGYDNLIILTLGTGVGGGIIIDNKLLKGKSGAAGEMHFKMSVDNKRHCTCGADDCFEIYASGMGLVLTYEEFTGEILSTFEIISKFNNKEPNAIKALEKWNKYIAIGALGLNNIFDTDIIALTGSMAQFADVSYIEDYVNKYTVTTKTKVQLAKAGNYSGVIGAALVALNN